MSKTGKKVAAGIVGTVASLGLGVGIYDHLYRRKFTLATSNEDEQSIPDYDENSLIIKNTDWVSEDNYAEKMNNQVFDYLNQFKEPGSFHREEGTIVYNFYGLPDPKATIVMHHGFLEYKEKYSEMIYYYLQNNFQVMILDARGHGHSREDSTVHKVNTKDFNVLVEDFKHLVDKTKELTDDELPIILFGHSMGGAVSSAFAQRYPKELDGLVLNAPMFSINTQKVPYSMTYLLSGVSAQLNLGEMFIPTTKPQAPVSEIPYRENNKIVNSDIRGQYFFDLRKSIFENPTVGGTMNWLYAAMRMVHSITKPENIKMIRVPTLLIRAGEDKVVDPWGLFQFGTHLPKVNSYVLEGSDHETFHNHDKEIMSYFQIIMEYMNEIVESVK